MLHGRLQHILSELSVPAFLVTDVPDVFYLTGMNLDGVWLLVTKEGPVIFTSPMLREQAAALAPGIPVIDGDKMIDLVASFCKKRKIPVIGIDPVRQTACLKQQLQNKIKTRDLLTFPAEFRQIKTDDEIESIRNSCRIAIETVEQVHSGIEPGMTEEEIAFKIEELFAKKRVRPSFLPIVASGPNTANPHHLSSNRKIEENDVVLIDLGCVLKGYCSDLTRTFYFGKINRLQREVHVLVQKAHDAAVKRVRAGMKAKDVDTIARGIIAAAGYGDAFIHSTGHGIGVEVHEAPRISRKNPAILEPGMVITIEPGVYLPGQFGVRIEDTILITEKGSEVLTQ